MLKYNDTKIDRINRFDNYFFINKLLQKKKKIK